MIRLVQRLEAIRETCRGRNVLHLGCTNWPYTAEAIDNEMLLHFDLEKIAARVVGFDYDQAGIDVLASHGSKDLYRADLERLDEVEYEGTFDVIVAGEMIEHLNNPGLFLTGIKRFMNADTLLVITTVNAYSAMRFAIYGLRGKGGVSEPVHPDHVAYYSYKTLTRMIERHGFEIDDFMFYDVGDEHRPFQRRLWLMMNDVAVRLSPQLSDGVVAVCRLKS